MVRFWKMNGQCNEWRRLQKNISVYYNRFNNLHDFAKKEELLEHAIDSFVLAKDDY